MNRGLARMKRINADPESGVKGVNVRRRVKGAARPDLRSQISDLRAITGKRTAKTPRTQRRTKVGCGCMVAVGFCAEIDWRCRAGWIVRT